MEIGDGFETARRRGSRAHDEMYPGPDGVVRWVQWEVTPWRGAKGQIDGLLLMIHEITDMVGLFTFENALS